LSWDNILLLVTILIVVYTWVGYPALLRLLRLFRGRALAHGGAAFDDGAAAKPFVSIIVPAHDEGKRIAAKLRNCLELAYPADRLEILVASDGSTDTTEEIVEEFAARDARIRLLRGAGRMGKSGVQNLAAREAKGELFFLTDAETCARPDVLAVLVSNFADPEVGLATATLHLREPSGAIAKGQGLYWGYELFLRQAESDLGTLATSSGAALAIRRELFVPMQACYGDDCILPLDVRLQGYRVIQDPRAIVFDAFPHSIQGELRARARMVARNWTGTLSRPAILNPLRFPATAWGLVSHKFLRWLTPFFLAGLFFASTTSLLHGRFVLLWLLQAGFYGSAWVGWLLTRSGRRTRVLALPFAFCLANVGFLLGVLRALRGQTVVGYANPASVGTVMQR
jgi:cellulose synthase/poly-beta-1,6-N-acetylglucosamine synthase-like glycosyltransferase